MCKWRNRTPKSHIIFILLEFIVVVNHSTCKTCCVGEKERGENGIGRKWEAFLQLNFYMLTADLYPLSQSFLLKCGPSSTFGFSLDCRCLSRPTVESPGRIYQVWGFMESSLLTNGRRLPLRNPDHKGLSGTWPWHDCLLDNNPFGDRGRPQRLEKQLENRNHKHQRLGKKF